MNALRRAVQRHFPAGSFKRDAAILGLGTFGAQAIGVAVSPLVTRLYGPSAMGIYTTVYAAASLYGGFATFKFELRIPSEEDEAEARKLFAASMLSPLLLAPIFVGAIALLPALRSALGLAESSPIDLALLAVFAVSLSFNQGLVMFMGRIGALADVARSRTLQILTSAALQVALGFAFANSSALLFAAVAAQVATNRYLAVKLRKATGEGISLALMRNVARELPRMVRRSWHIVVSFGIGAVAYQMPVMTVASAYGSSAAGQYGLAQRILSLPIGILSQSLGEAFRIRAGRLVMEGKSTRPLQLKVAGCVSASMLPVALGFYFFGDRAFSIVFGKEWAMGGTIASYMLFASVITLSASITDKISVLVNARRYILAWQASRLAYTLGLWWLARHDALNLLAYAKWLMVCYTALYLVDFAACFAFGRNRRVDSTEKKETKDANEPR